MATALGLFEDASLTTHQNGNCINTAYMNTNKASPAACCEQQDGAGMVQDQRWAKATVCSARRICWSCVFNDGRPSSCLRSSTLKSTSATLSTRGDHRRVQHIGCNRVFLPVSPGVSMQGHIDSPVVRPLCRCGAWRRRLSASKLYRRSA